MVFMVGRRYPDFRFSHGGNTGSNPVGDANDFFRERRFMPYESAVD
jgi:hypothetical protein